MNVKPTNTSALSIKQLIKEITEENIKLVLNDSFDHLKTQVSNWENKVSDTLNEELFVETTPSEVSACSNISELCVLVENQLVKNSAGENIIDIYEIVRRISEEEYHPRIKFSWYSKWNDFLKAGNFLTRPDSLDSVEMVIRFEKEFKMSISDREAERMETVRDTVRYIFKKTSSV